METLPAMRRPTRDRKRAVPGRAAPSAWLCWIVFGVVFSTGYFVSQGAGVQGYWPVVLYCAVSGGSVLAIMLGIRLRRPRALVAWTLLAAGQVMFTAGDVGYFVHTVRHGDASYPLVANVFYLLQYPLVAGALLILIMRRTPGRNIPAMIDAAITSIGAALLYWVFLIGPMMTAPGVSPMDRFAAVVYPVMDLLVLTLALRLMLGGGVRSKSYFLLIGFFVLVLLADTGYGLQSLIGEYVPGTWLDAGWLLGYLLLGAAALHPSVGRVDERARPVPVDATRYRIALLATATLTSPAVLVIHYFKSDDTDLIVVACASAMLFLLVLWRMSGLLAAQRRLAVTDGLTGLSTRRFLQDNLTLETSRAARRDTTLGFVIIDVDHFKRVNDTYGHPAGDAVLGETARRLRDICRTGDLVARYGGEEFAVLVPGATVEGLAALGERIRSGMASRPVVVQGSVEIPVTVSVGAAVMPVHAGTPGDLVHAADRALYMAKAAGRNRVVLGDDAHAPAVAEPDHLEPLIGEWTAALQRDKDAPTVDTVQTQAVCTAWALMRTGAAGHPVLSARKAADELRHAGRTHLNPHVVEAFLNLAAQGRVGTVPVRVTDGVYPTVPAESGF